MSHKVVNGFEPSIAAPAATTALPCLLENNCTKIKELSPYRKKQADTLRMNISSMIERYGLNYIGFMTLTFRENVTDPKVAQKRWHSFRTHVMRERYREWIKIFERQKSGRIHYHLILVMNDDIRTGFDHEAVAKSTRPGQTCLKWSTAGQDSRKLLNQLK